MRHFNPLTRTEAVDGIHDLTGTTELPDDHWFFTLETVPAGKLIAVEAGEPLLVDEPAPTREELVAAADAQKQLLRTAANDYMNNKQWPGKAAIGRLKGEELAQYGLWLDYLDALAAIDTATAPDVEWPEKPE
ncbi:tail fiber assembly protein [Pseudescherichia sp.]|uniref:tail fiber assembly protein n=1 Tax=Pseudescherichia sp. TaxID=2055881 RepID=UPI002896EAD1|nr:tail fiber assembly protein [Pseudescherichia sp.]